MSLRHLIFPLGQPTFANYKNAYTLFNNLFWDQLMKENPDTSFWDIIVEENICPDDWEAWVITPLIKSLLGDIS